MLRGVSPRSAIDRANALVHLEELSATNDEARTALIRILRQSPEPALRERAAKITQSVGPEWNLALEQAATDDPSLLVRRAALQSLQQRFLQGAWQPGPDEIERLLVFRQREVSPRVLKQLDQLLGTVPQTE